jgi:hypothetical protein
MYFEMCWEWHEQLSPDQQETCLTLADVIASAPHPERNRAVAGDEAAIEVWDGSRQVHYVKRLP